LGCDCARGGLPAQLRPQSRLPEQSARYGDITIAVRALRWFVKSLAIEVLHDEFIFLWIALEILCDASGAREERPYTGPCHHEIPQCPECGRPTAQMVRSSTLRKFIEGFGIDGEASSRRLWKYRQRMPFPATLTTPALNRRSLRICRRRHQSSGDLARVSQKLDGGSRLARSCRSQ
jgi:hypothetical protein